MLKLQLAKPGVIFPKKWPCLRCISWPLAKMRSGFIASIQYRTVKHKARHPSDLCHITWPQVLFTERFCFEGLLFDESRPVYGSMWPLNASKPVFPTRLQHNLAAGTGGAWCALIGRTCWKRAHFSFTCVFVKYKAPNPARLSCKSHRVSFKNGDSHSGLLM
jgi:hypothetical protein